MPTISIISPVYNGIPYISEMLDSVLNQTFTDFEHLLVDDGSEDETKRVLSEYADNDPRIKVFFREHVGNPIVQRKYGIARSSGSYICFLDQDDLWKPDKLQKQVDFFTNHPDIGVLFTGALTIDKNSKIIESAVPSEKPNPIWNWIFKHENQSEKSQFFIIDPNLLIFGDPLENNSCMVPRRIYNELGGFHDSSDLLGVADYLLWLLLGQKYKIVILNDPLVLSRRTGTNLTRLTYSNYAHVFSTAEKIAPGLMKQILKPWGAFGKRRWYDLLSTRSRKNNENKLVYFLSKRINRLKFYCFAMLSRLDGSYKKMRH